LVEPVVQSAGSVRDRLASTFVGPKAPLLWSTAEAVTLKAEPAFADAGLDTETLETFTSEVASMFVFELLEPALFPGVGSETCNWSIDAVAVTERLWADGLVQVTDQLAGDAGTVVAVEMTRDVFWTVCGLAEPVVQSAGRVRANAVSTLAGP
jgi:hypothetical protein